METALLEKNRIADEEKAHDYVLEGIAKAVEIKKTVRGFKQRLDIAKELRASGQVKLFERAIDKVERAYKIAHQNPYPECTKQEAMDAMCEPIKPQEPSPVEKVKGSMNDNMRKTLDRAMQSAQRITMQDNSMRQAINQMQAYQQAMRVDTLSAFRFVTQPGQMFGLSAQMAGSWDRQFIGGYSRATHKYDLSCAPLRLGKLVEGDRETDTMLPMSALCRLKEASDKKMFDAFEVWRPAEWKAPDPWLVGVWHEDNGVTHYFKVCDWR